MIFRLVTGLICAWVPPPLRSLYFHSESALSSPVKCSRWQTNLIMLLGNPWSRPPPKPSVEHHTYTCTHMRVQEHVCVCMHVHINTWAMNEGKEGSAFRTAVKRKRQSAPTGRGMKTCMSQKLSEHLLLLLLLLILVWFIFIHKPKYVKLPPSHSLEYTCLLFAKNSCQEMLLLYVFRKPSLNYSWLYTRNWANSA